MPLRSTISLDFIIFAAGMTQALTEATKDQLSPAVILLGVILIILIFTSKFMKK